MPRKPSDSSELETIKNSIKVLQEQVRTLHADVDILKGNSNPNHNVKKTKLLLTDDDRKEPDFKRQKTNSSSGVTLPCGTGKSPDDPIHVYTDGACGSNGMAGAAAGIGVYWGPNHHLNVSERISGKQTNNRAEIHAAVRALRQVKELGARHVILYTDSSFMINAITKWINKWKKNGWKLADGGPVKNKEDFQELDEARDGMKVEWVHVAGHSGIEGNEAADKLATSALKLPPLSGTIV